MGVEDVVVIEEVVTVDNKQVVMVTECDVVEVVEKEDHEAIAEE